MIIAISGTPGTGKSEVAKMLSQHLNANLINIKKLVDKHKVPYILDKKRDSKTIDIKDLQQAVSKTITKDKTNIIEGHLSHFIKSDIIVVLRTRPDILRKRLKQRNWKEAKIKENVQAEILGVITAESMQHHRVFEIDTSSLKPEPAAGIIEKILNNHSLRKYHAGHIDWSEKYKKDLLV